MEKIININMAGQVIAIEDSAYTSLKSYLESLYNLFASEQGRDEILNDIESRIAELMSDKIRSGAVAITEKDIQEIITSMGRVEDFAASEDDPQQVPPRTESRGARGQARFRRDSNDKVAGGVCSGLANYLNVDPALVRIVFAILTLGGWGAGFLLYVALWILVPAAPLDSYRGRRLFRSQEDKWLGGVCSGLAVYFDKDIWMFRLLFAVPILLSILSGSMNMFMGPSVIFGSFTFTFALIYIVLWMVLPLATSDFEKMEMRGEKVDLNSIRQNVYAGMDDIKARAREWSGEVQETATRFSGEAANFMTTRGREFAREAAAAAHPIASRGGHIIGTLLRVFFLCVASAIAFGLFVALIAYVYTGMAEFADDFIFYTAAQKMLSWVVVILLLGVPLIAIITYIVRRAIKVRTHNRYLGKTFAALWFIGFVCMLCLGGMIANDFRKYEKVATQVPIIQPDSGKLILTVPGRMISYSNSQPWLDGAIDGWDVAGDSMMSAHVQVRADVSPDSQYHISVLRYSAGSSRREALNRAQQIDYPVSSVSDSVVAMANGYAISNTQKYRRQNVVVEVLVPVGKKLRIDRSVGDKLNSVGFVVSEDAVRRNRNWNIEWDDVYEEWQTDIDYVMSASGELIDPAHPPKDTKAQAQMDNEEKNRIDSLDRQLEALQRQKDSLEEHRGQ